MVCPKCGKEINEGLKFCTQCGTRIGEVIEGNNIIEEKSVDNSTEVSAGIENTDKPLEYVNNVEYPNTTDNTSSNNLSNNKKKSNTGLIITLVIVAVVAIIGVSAVILWKVNSNKVDGNNVTSNNYINNNSNSTKDNNNNNNNSNSNSNTLNNNSNNNEKVNSNNKLVTKFDNYNVDIDMTMEVSDMSLDAKITGTVDEKNQIEYLKMSMEMMGFNLSTETYTDFKNGITYMSIPITGGWSKETDVNRIVDLNSLLDSLTSMKNVQKIDDNHFKVVITDDDIKGMAELSDIDLDDIVDDISADIYLKDGYIEEIKYDFSNLTSELGKLYMDMKISNYDKAGSVTIPEDVIKNATED